MQSNDLAKDALRSRLAVLHEEEMMRGLRDAKQEMGRQPIIILEVPRGVFNPDVMSSVSAFAKSWGFDDTVAKVVVMVSSAVSAIAFDADGRERRFFVPPLTSEELSQKEAIMKSFSSCGNCSVTFNHFSAFCWCYFWHGLGCLQMDVSLSGWGIPTSSWRWRGLHAQERHDPTHRWQHRCNGGQGSWNHGTTTRNINEPWNLETCPHLLQDVAQNAKETSWEEAKSKRLTVQRSQVQNFLGIDNQGGFGPKEVRMARTLAKAVAHSSFEQCVDAERFREHFTPAHMAAAVRRQGARCIYVDARAEERRYCAVSRTVHDLLKKVWRRKWQWRVNESALFLVGPVGLLDCRSGAIRYALKVPFVIHGWCNPHCVQPDWQNTERWWFLLGLHLPFNPGCTLSALHNWPVGQTAQCSWQRLKVGLFRSCWIGTLKCSILQAQKFGDDINHFSLLYSIQLHPIALFHLPNASHAKVVKTSGTPSISRSIPAFVIMQDFGNGFYQSLEAMNYWNSLQNLIVSRKIQPNICWHDISKQSPALDVGSIQRVGLICEHRTPQRYLKTSRLM